MPIGWIVSTTETQPHVYTLQHCVVGDSGGRGAIDSTPRHEEQNVGILKLRDPCINGDFKCHVYIGGEACLVKMWTRF